MINITNNTKKTLLKQGKFIYLTCFLFNLKMELCGKIFFIFQEGNELELLS